MLAVVGALVLIALQTWRMVAEENASLLHRFAEEQERQVSEVAKALGEDLDDVRDDLRFVARLLSTADEETGGRELRALLAAVAVYRLAAVYDRDGHRLLRIDDPRTTDVLDAAPFEASMQKTARATLGHPAADLLISPTAPVERLPWYRVFSVAIPSTGPRPLALAVLVDTEPFFKRTRPLVSTASTRLLVLGRDGVPLPGSDPTIARLVAGDARDTLAYPNLSWLVEHMANHDHGEVRLEALEAAKLAMGDKDVIATYAPIGGSSAHGWSIAKLASTATLREHEQRTLLRLGVGAAAVAICCILLGAYFVAAARRALLVGERLRHAEALALLHAKTETILDHIPAAVIAFSDDLQITALNLAARALLPDVALGDPVATTLAQAEQGAVTRILVLLRDALAHGQVKSLVAERLNLFGAEGHYSVHAISLGPHLRDARVILVIEDLTQVRTLATQLLHAEKLATVGILAAGIAHEVGTPIGVIRGRAEFVVEKLGTDHRDARDIAIIVEQADLVTRSIRQLLDFSRTQPTEVRAVSVAAVTSAVLELLHIEAERRKIQLTAEVPAVLPSIAADRDQLQQLLVNLLMNACDACTSGGRVTILAQVEPPTHKDDGEVVRIEVADDGCGIPERNRHQVFDPFFTTKKRGQGTGLGLTIAAQIVRNHGGQIDLASDGERGTRVVVRWPTARSSQTRRDDALVS